jgi:hypothetical protein
MTRSGCRGVLALLLLSFLVGEARAAKINITDDTFVDLKLLMQPWVQWRYSSAFDPRPQNQLNFYLRRTRIILGGQITKWVSFFVDTDLPNWGKNDGTKAEQGSPWASPSFIVQDAYVSVDLHPAVHIMTGLILPPFVRHSIQGATSLHTLDYHSFIVKYPLASNIVWRDVGVMVRGLLWCNRLDYRFSITNGTPNGYTVAATGTTPATTYHTNGLPRFTGRIAYNVFDPEDQVFLGGTYLGTKKVLSVGLAMDGQPRSFNTSGGGSASSYFGVGGDVFVDLPMGKNRISGQADVVFYGGDANPDKGVGLLFDVGYAIGPWEPLLLVDWFKFGSKDDFKDQLFGIHGGLNFWWKGHAVNWKLDVGWVKNAGVDMGKGELQTTLQTQLLL